MENSRLRLLGAMLSLVVVAAACGSTADTATDDTTTTDTAADTEEMAMEDEEMDQDMAIGDMDHDEEHSHDHDAGLEVDALLPIPGVEIDVVETDVDGSFIVNVSLENFTITEENVDADPIDNEGHMHLYIDGERIGRFFETEYEVDIWEGEHLIEVELSANNHSAYTIDGEPIRAAATVTGFGKAPVEEELDPADAAASLTATYVDGTVELEGNERIEVAEGDIVMLMVSSDVEEEVHVHGVDIFANVGPEEDAMVVFEADTPGRFEIEFEGSGQLIAELLVS